MIPNDKQAAFNELRPGRKMIIQHYYFVKEKERRSRHHIIQRVAIYLGYSLDTNGRNSHVARVINEFDPTAKRRKSSV